MKPKLQVLLIGNCILAATTILPAATFNWAQDDDSPAGGDWSLTTGAGWVSSGTYPKVADDIANVNKNIGTNQTITINVADAKTGTLFLQDNQTTPSDHWNVATSDAALNALTFEVTTGKALLRIGRNANGANAVSAPIKLNSNLEIRVETGNAGLNISGVISDGSGSFGIEKTGPNLLTLSAANTFTGTTTFSGTTPGKIRIAHASALIGSTVTVLTGGFEIAAGVTGTNFGAISGIGNLVLTNLSATPGATTLAVGASNADTTYSGVLSGLGALTKRGTGTLTLEKSNTFAGSPLIETGSIQAGINDSLPPGSVLRLGGTGGNATFKLNGFDQTVAGIRSVGTNSRFIVNGSATTSTLTIHNTTNEPYGGQMGNGAVADDNNFNLVKSGSGTQTLSNATGLTFTGTTTIIGGTLSLLGNLPNSPTITVQSGATLAANGISIAGDVNVLGGASLDPGKAGLTIGTDGTSAHDISGGNLLMEVDGIAAGEFDNITLNGSLDITGTNLVTSGGNISPPNATPITIINGNTEAVAGTFSGLVEGASFLIDGQVFQINYAAGGDSFDVVLTPIDAPLVSIAANTTEALEGSTAGFTVTSTPPPTGEDITVTLAYSGTAADGTDFTGQASIDILDGNATAALNLPLLTDGLIEGPESLTVTVTQASGPPVIFVGPQNPANMVILDGNSKPAVGSAINQTVIDSNPPVAPAPIVVTDEAGGSSFITGISTAPAFVYSGLSNQTTFSAGFSGSASQNAFQLTPNPTAANGFAIDLEFTPSSADVGSPTNYRSVWEIGGTNNGCGIYLIDGIPHFIAKMNGTDAGAPTGLTDTDWTGNSVCVPLAVSALTGNQRVRLALVFDLDSIDFSVNGATPATQAFTGRTGQTDWFGTPHVDIGTLAVTFNQRGGLSTDSLATGFFTDTFVALSNAPNSGAVTTCRFWNTSTGSISATAGSPETVTATLTIRNWTSDANEGSLSATSGNGETYNSGVWSASGTLAQVNAALAALQFQPGSAGLAAVDLVIDDLTSIGSTTGVLVFASAAPSLVYVDDNFSGSFGTNVADADGGTIGNQGAIFGFNAFSNLTAALAAANPVGSIIVNDGDYSAESIALTGTVALQLTATTGGVAIGSLDASATNTLSLQSNTLTLGNATLDNNIDCPITGTGGLTKTGADRLNLRGENTYTGTTTVNQGALRVSTQALPLPSGSLDSPVIVAFGAQFELNPVLGTTLTHSTQISGGGAVLSMNDGTVVFDGPANPFTGGFRLGDGGTTAFNGTSGSINGFVVIGHSGHLGTGIISSFGSQLQASTTGIVITNDINIEGGGFRLGGSNNFELSGSIVPLGSTRSIGHYSLGDVTFTLSGTIETDGGGTPINITFEGTNALDNGNFNVTADISGSAVLTISSNFDDGVITWAGDNTHTGPTNINAGTLLLTGTHTGGGTITVTTAATLGGTGSTASAVNIAAGGVLAPGVSIGSLTGGSTIALADTSIFAVQIDSSLETADSLVAGGAVTLTAGTSLNITDIAGAAVQLDPGAELILINHGSNTLTGTFNGLADLAEITVGPNTFEIDYDTDLGGGAFGVVLRSVEAGSPYEVWAGTHPGLAGGFGDDDDNDGSPNGHEWYFFSSDPLAADGNGSPLTEVTATGAGTFTFSHRRPVDREGLTEDYEWTTTLAGAWNANAASDGTHTVTLTPGTPVPDVTNPGYEFVTVTVSATPATAIKLFARLVLELP